MPSPITWPSMAAIVGFLIREIRAKLSRPARLTSRACSLWKVCQNFRSPPEQKTPSMALAMTTTLQSISVLTVSAAAVSSSRVVASSALTGGR